MHTKEIPHAHFNIDPRFSVNAPEIVALVKAIGFTVFGFRLGNFDSSIFSSTLRVLVCVCEGVCVCV